MRNLRETREEYGLSMSELGRMVGTTHQRISYIESGKHDPGLDIAVKIAVVLNTTVDDLVREREGAAG